MTREEEIQKAWDKYRMNLHGSYPDPPEEFIAGFKAGEKFADTHPAKKQAITIDGYLYRFPNGTLSLFSDNPADFITDLNENDFPKVTFENSPKEVKVTIELKEEI